jgi:hypothetical protein
MATKGQKIRFIGGKYGGKKGWINADRPASEERTYVIVNLKKKGLRNTFVMDFSFAFEPTTEPASYARAVIQQCPDLDCALTKLCRDFAECSIKKDLPGFAVVLGEKLEEAAALLESKGSKARYRRIKFDS